MAIVVGQAVRGENFWDRPHLMDDIVDRIDSGAHILLAAPRRVGKTSLMYRVLDTMSEEYIIVYINTEAEHSVDAFWEKLFHELMDDEFVGTLKTRAKNLWRKITSTSIGEISIKGVKLDDSKPIDYEDAFVDLLKSIDEGKKLILLLDEFSQTIENIIRHESTEKAEQLLQAHRQIRQNHKLSGKSVFVYAGSIGLESVVANINASKHINDLTNISVPPLEEKEAKAFVEKLCKTNKMEIQDGDIEYLLKQIEWYIPFYIQLLTLELRRLYKIESIINQEVIDRAIQNALASKKDFIHWEERLNVLPKENRAYAKKLLSLISSQGEAEYKELANIATKHQLSEDEAKNIIHMLIYDGYINKSDDRKYRFNSPLLKRWWNDNVTN